MNLENVISKTKKNLRKLAYAGLVVAVLAGGGEGEAKAEPIFENIPVCTEPGDQMCPAIWGDYIVWQGAVNEAYKISERKIVDMPGLVIPELYTKQCMWNNHVVWDNSVGYYDLNLKQMVHPPGLSIGYAPAIHNNKLVWSGTTGYYDLDSQQMINLPGLSIGDYPAIFGDRIAWKDSGGYYDITSEKMIFPPGLSVGIAPSIWEDKIAWWNSGGYYDLSQEKMISSTDLKYMRDPIIYDENIVYWKKQDGPTLFVWDIINNERVVSSYGVVGENIDIWENTIAWSDRRNGNWDIYMATIPEPTTLSLLGLGTLALLSRRNKIQNGFR